MTMRKMPLTTYWSPEEAYSILLFLDELREVLLDHYGDDIADHYRQQLQEENDPDSAFEDDMIPF